MLASLLVLTIIGVAGQTQWRFVDAALRGAPVATPDALVNGHRGPVRVLPELVVPTTPQSPPDALVVVSASQQLVALDRSTAQPGTAVWGQLRPLTLVEQARLPMRTSDGSRPTADRLPKFLLDTGGPSRLQLQIAVGVAAVIAMLAAVAMIRAVGHAQRPLHSPAGRALARFGDPAMVRDAFDDAMRNDHLVSGRLHAPDGFLGFRTRRGFAVLPRTDVMWVRQGVRPEPAFFSFLAFPVLVVQAFASKALYVHDRHGKRTRVPMSSRHERHTVVRELEAAVPHAIFVDDVPTRRYWRQQRRHFVAAVDERRALIESYRSNGFVGPEVDVRTAWGLASDDVDEELFEAAEHKRRDANVAPNASRLTLRTGGSFDGGGSGVERQPNSDAHTHGFAPLGVTLDMTVADDLDDTATGRASSSVSVKRALVDARAQRNLSQ